MKRLLGVLGIALTIASCGGGTTTSGAPSAAPGESQAAASDTPAPQLCATDNPADATFTFWTFVDRHATWWQSRADEWNKENADRPITLNCSVIAYEQMHNNLAAAFTSGSGAPNLVDIEIGKFANFTKGTIHLVDMTAEAQSYAPDLVATRLAPTRRPASSTPSTITWARSLPSTTRRSWTQPAWTRPASRPGTTTSQPARRSRPRSPTSPSRRSTSPVSSRSAA